MAVDRSMIRDPRIYTRTTARTPEITAGARRIQKDGRKKKSRGTWTPAKKGFKGRPDGVRIANGRPANMELTCTPYHASSPWIPGRLPRPHTRSHRDIEMIERAFITIRALI